MSGGRSGVPSAVLEFFIVANASENPVGTFRRLSFAALIVSLIPNVGAVFMIPGTDWPSMSALLLLHIVAWAICTSMLTRLTRRTAR